MSEGPTPLRPDMADKVFVGIDPKVRDSKLMFYRWAVGSVLTEVRIVHQRRKAVRVIQKMNYLKKLKQQYHVIAHKGGWCK